jgi:hypothetical protein
MRGILGGHDDDHALEQLDPFLVTEDPGLEHQVVLVYGEETARRVVQGRDRRFQGGLRSLLRSVRRSRH